MQFHNEIARAVRHQVATDTTTTKTREEIKAIESAVISAVSSLEYDFSKSESIVLNQEGKKRLVKQYRNIYSPESILCQCIKQILDRTFRIKYPNRNRTIRTLFDTLRAVKQMAEFTIIKYDFKDYFNSVSSSYVFHKYIKEKLNDRFESDLIMNFVENTKYTYAGLSTSNVIAEIIAQKFDDDVRLAFFGKEILFFERYIDDSIIVINENIELSYCNSLLNNVVKKIFHDKNIDSSSKCKTKINNKKSIYISRRGLNSTQSVDYLGYNFIFSVNKKGNAEISYGITQEKQKRYNSRIDSIISLYKNRTLDNGSENNDYNDIELLRQRISAFTSRTVYQSKKFKSIIWKIKGFIGNYGELRYLLDTQQIDQATKIFLENMVRDAFRRANIKFPYFIKNNSAGYSLFSNMKTNKTLLFVDRIGYSKTALLKLCSKVGIISVDKEGKMRGYRSLVREYLIKLKVGY